LLEGDGGMTYTRMYMYVLFTLTTN
jgi:hypothetical protein